MLMCIVPYGQLWSPEHRCQQPCPFTKYCRQYWPDIHRVRSPGDKQLRETRNQSGLDNLKSASHSSLLLNWSLQPQLLCQCHWQQIYTNLARLIRLHELVSLDAQCWTQCKGQQQLACLQRPGCRGKVGVWYANISSQQVSNVRSCALIVRHVYWCL